MLPPSRALLRSCGEAAFQQRLAERRAGRSQGLVVAGVGHARERAEADAAAADLHAVQLLDAGDVDQPGRRRHVELEQVDHGGAAGEHLPALVGGEQPHGVGQAGSAVIGEVAHDGQPRRASRTISTAATMFG